MRPSGHCNILLKFENIIQCDVWLEYIHSLIIINYKINTVNKQKNKLCSVTEISYE